jgi:type III restriction enzyme
VDPHDPKQVNNYTITVFAKLPKISIQTPFKTYNPDFAYMLADKADSNKKLFFIAETKGYNNLNEIPNQEKLKIDYAEKFFLALSNTYNNSNLKIAFKTRLNTNTLLDLIKGI